MDSKEKKQLSEIDICDLFITPAIKEAGWDQLTQVRREVTLTPGPVVVRGNMSSRNKKKKKFADYVLQWEAGMPIAIVEAKDNKHTVKLWGTQIFCTFPALSARMAMRSLRTTSLHRRWARK